jgi:hypothetical protein
MTDISASADNIEMLRSVRDRLFDAFRDGDCPVRELSALARRLQEVGSEIAQYDNTPEAWQKHLTDLGYLQAHMAAAVNRPDCPYRELSPLTRRLQDIVKDIASTRQKVTLVESKVRKRNGRTNLATSAARPFESFDPSTI